MLLYTCKEHVGLLRLRTPDKGQCGGSAPPQCLSSEVRGAEPRESSPYSRISCNFLPCSSISSASMISSSSPSKMASILYSVSPMR